MMPPWKVMHVITRLDRGGSAQNTMLTAMLHDRTRFAPVVVAGRTGRWDMQGGEAAVQVNRDRLKAAAVPVHVVPALTREIHPILDMLALRQLAALCRSEGPAVIHTHTSKAGVLGRVAARMAKVPVVVHTPHGHVFYGHFGPLRSKVFEQVERVLARRTHALIALTESERDEHLIRGVGRAERFAVIPSGIDLDIFRCPVGVRQAERATVGCPSDAIVVGSVGWLTTVKGHRFLIEAAARLKGAFPRLHVVILGSGDLGESLAALAQDRGIGDAVHLLGERSDVPACLAAMDVFVLPSLNEGMGRALVEAMAARLPVVATRVGGIPAIVEDGKTGLLVPAADTEALASALRRLLSEPTAAREMGVAAAASIGDRFSAAHMVRSVEAIYRRCLNEVGIA